MGAEFGPKPDMRGRDERLWGTKKDAGRSAADVEALDPALNPNP